MLMIAGDVDSPQSRARAAAEEATGQLTQAALLEKSVKSKLALATDHFNRSPSKGFDYLQVASCTPFIQNALFLVTYTACINADVHPMAVPLNRPGASHVPLVLPSQYSCQRLWCSMASCKWEVSIEAKTRGAATPFGNACKAGMSCCLVASEWLAYLCLPCFAASISCSPAMIKSPQKWAAVVRRADFEACLCSD